MDKHKHYQLEDWRETTSEGWSVAGLVLVLALVFSIYFCLRVAMPELPLRVHEALALLDKAH